MSYARLEAESWASVREHTSARVAALEERLDAAADGRAPADAADLARELRYLERVTAVLGAGAHASRGGGLHAKVVELRRRAERLVGAPAAELVVPEADAASASASSSQHPLHSGARRGIGAVASFLFPGDDPVAAEDEVRALAVEGRLQCELGQYPVLSFGETQTAMVFPRSWSEDDDQRVRERELRSVLELSHAAAVLRELSDLLGEQVEQAQESLDEVESNLANARDRVQEGVGLLTDTSQQDTGSVGWLPSSLGFALICATLMHPASSSGLLTKLALRGLVAAGSYGFARTGTRKLSEYQRKVLERMKGQLPRFMAPIPAADAAVLAALGQEAAERLRSKLAEKDWRDYWPSLVAHKAQLPARWRPSDVRIGGSAWCTEFACELRAAAVFRIVQRLSLEGPLDPGCKVVWSRPVDGQEGTFLRYLAFSDWLFNQDFFSVCRCGVAGLPSSGEAEDTGCYAWALTSIGPDLLSRAGLPMPSEGIVHCRIHVFGICVTDQEGGGCNVQVMADSDPAPVKAPTFVVDSAVRLHVLHTAQALRERLGQRQQEAATELQEVRSVPSSEVPLQ